MDDHTWLQGKRTAYREILGQGHQQDLPKNQISFNRYDKFNLANLKSK